MGHVYVATSALRFETLLDLFFRMGWFHSWWVPINFTYMTYLIELNIRLLLRSTNSLDAYASCLLPLTVFCKWVV